MQPDIIQMGPANRLVSVAQVARELGVGEGKARAWLEEVGVPIREVGDREYVGLGTLEERVWVWFGGEAEKMGKARNEYGAAAERAVRARVQRNVWPLGYGMMRREKREKGRDRNREDVRAWRARKRAAKLAEREAQGGGSNDSGE